MRFDRALVGFVVAVALLVAAPAARAQTDYADAGSHAYGTTALDAGTAGATGGSLVVPNDPGPFPLLIASHGWSAASAQQLGWAQHFASWGFVVAVPDFPNTLTPDAQVDQGIIRQLVALYSNPSTDSPAKGKVDPARVGLEGHSAGGLATTLAAQGISPGAVVLFDPVDAADAGAAAYANLCSPLLGIFANGSSCNNSAEWSTFATDTSAPLVFFHVVGSTHCDGENQDRGAACGLVCGGAADPTRQAIYARYATAFFLAHLKGDTAAAALFAPAALAADPGIADAGTQAGQPCAAGGGPGGSGDGGGGGTLPGDDGGGTPAPPTGGSSGGAGPGTTAGGADGGTGGAGGNGGGSGAPPGTSGGCGCTFAGSSPAGSAFALVLAVAAVARRRRQARG